MMLTCSMQHVVRTWPWRWMASAMKSWRKATFCALTRLPSQSWQSSRPRSMSLSLAQTDQSWLQDMLLWCMRTQPVRSAKFWSSMKPWLFRQKRRKKTRSLQGQIPLLFVASSLPDLPQWTPFNLRSSWAASRCAWMEGQSPLERSQSFPSQLVTMPKSCSPDWADRD